MSRILSTGGGWHAWQGACVAGGHAWRGHAWQGASMAGDVHGRGVCVVGGHAWWGDMCSGGHAWQGGVHGWGCMVVACMVGGCAW